jgi:predicted short-subunit dehydrogenase-like oxidoreductase (DUF2520 family)
MRVAVVGPGRVGTLLAAALTRARHRVVAVAGGSVSSRQRVTTALPGVRAHDDPVSAARVAELVVLAVPDDAVAAVVDDLVRADALGVGHRVVHLAGSRGLAPLRRAALTGARTAALHPAMTVPAGASDPDLLVGTAWAVTAAAADRGWAHDLVADLGGDPHDVADDVRGLYHAGLAVGSNTVGAAVAVARQLLLAAGIDDPRPFLAPLVDRSVANVLRDGAAALTGPVVRGDVGTVTGHLDALDADVPELLEAYRDLTRVLLGRVRPALDEATVARLEAVLAPPASGPPLP